MSNYRVQLYNSRGEPIGDLSNFSMLDMVRTENQSGTLAVSCPATESLYNLLHRDYLIDVSRYVGGRWTHLGDTHFFIRKYEPGYNEIKIDCVDGMELLDRRVHAYNPDDVESTFDAELADDVMKYIVDYNYGGLASAERDLSDYLTIQGMQGQGALISKTCSGRRILALLQEVAKQSFEEGVYVGFDVVANGPGKFIFKTYANQRGVDHTFPNGLPPIIFSVDAGNLSVNSTIVYDYTAERNYIYNVASQPSGSYIQGLAHDDVRVGASPFNRYEDWYTASSYDVDTLLSEAQAYLGEGRPRLVFVGEAVQIPSCLFGVHYNFGDLVTAESKYTRMNCRVRTFRVHVSGGEESITVGMSNIDVDS